MPMSMVVPKLRAVLVIVFVVMAARNRAVGRRGRHRLDRDDDGAASGGGHGWWVGLPIVTGLNSAMLDWV